MYDLKNYKIKSEPVILGIESSCDETACAVIRGRKILADKIISSAAEQSLYGGVVKDGRTVLSSVIASSADMHAIYGGVVPEIASRAHTDAIDEVVNEALAEAGVTPREVDAVAVTYGAGLLGALLVGLSFAKSFAHALNIPLIAVNHIRGHMAAAYLDKPDLQPPFITLLASGGHTAILHTKSFQEAEVLASTCDDAAGEAFDKVARVLSLPYPGGPNVQRLAQEGTNSINLPSALAKNGSGATFSYSGLKTAVINYMHSAAQRGQSVNAADVAASFQCAAIDPLVKRTVELALQRGVQTVTAGGGVVANDYLRTSLQKACLGRGLNLVLPEKRHCTDNAAMIASEGLNQYLAGNFAPLSVNAKAAIPLK